MKLNKRTISIVVTVFVVLAVAVVGLLTHKYWQPKVQQLMAVEKSTTPESGSDHEQHDHEGHDHQGHDEAASIELSPQARKNVGLTTAPIKLQTFVRSITVPAVVIGRPGRSNLEVTAPLGGRVTRLYRIEGEAIEPGQPLFDLRLTHEELVDAQREFLLALEEKDVVQKEIDRLASIGAGVIEGRRLLERKYEQQKIEAGLRARREGLLLHGLSDEQVDRIQDTRKLLKGLTVEAPERPDNDFHASGVPEHPFTLRKLYVKPGQSVTAGTALCELIDYCELYIQGRAFEQDADQLVRAARGDWEITATKEAHSDQSDTVKGLQIAYVDNEVEKESRALHFYVRLPNEIVYESQSEDGHRFQTWRYKPGQRMQLSVPVQKWPDRIVLPVGAVAAEGVEYYVFQQNGDHFDRVPVHVEYKDQFSAVIANDGSIFPGDTVATSGAHQLQMALKSKAGGGVDPHAGHNH